MFLWGTPLPAVLGEGGKPLHSPGGWDGCGGQTGKCAGPWAAEGPRLTRALGRRAVGATARQQHAWLQCIAGPRRTARAAADARESVTSGERKSLITPCWRAGSTVLCLRALLYNLTLAGTQGSCWPSDARGGCPRPVPARVYPTWIPYIHAIELDGVVCCIASKFCSDWGGVAQPACPRPAPGLIGVRCPGRRGRGERQTPCVPLSCQAMTPRAENET